MKERLAKSVKIGVKVARGTIPIIRSLAGVVAPSGLGIAIAKESDPAIVVGFGIATGIIYLPLMIPRGHKGNSRKKE